MSQRIAKVGSAETRSNRSAKARFRDAQAGAGQTVERRSDLCEQIGCRRGRDDLAAGPGKERRAEPVFEQADLTTDRAMRDVEFRGRTRETAEPGGGLEGLDRIQGRQSRARHKVSFSHNEGQNKSIVTKAS